MSNTVLRIQDPFKHLILTTRFQDRLAGTSNKMLLVKDLTPEEIDELSQDSSVQVTQEELINLPDERPKLAEAP